LLGRKKRSFPFSHPKLSLGMALISSGKAPINEKRERKKKEVKREQLLIT